MKGIREIRRRIKAVKNTAQITRAMQLVASSKMKRAQEAALKGRSYALLLADIFESMGNHLPEIEHPLFKHREVKTRGILVLSTDKGLCGALNSNLFRKIMEVKDPVRYVCVGRKASQFISRTGRELMADFPISDRVRFSEVRVVVEYLIQAYLEGKIDTIEVLYSRFVNTLKQESEIDALLPFGNLVEELKELKKIYSGKLTFHLEDTRPMMMEPNVEALLAEIPALYIKQEIYQMVLDAKASEHSARMVSMKGATDNANTLVNRLTLDLNKARQAAITTEILDISASMVTN